MLIWKYRYKNQKGSKMTHVRPEFLDTLSRTLKVTQVLAVAFALAQVSIAMAVA